MKNILYEIIILFALFTESIAAQNTQIKGFENVDASVTSDTTTRNHFALGQFDLFITSQITDKVSFLSETVFLYYNNGFKIGIERAIINYHFKDYFNLSVGKLYSPLGYWNNAFHHGLVLQPTITRPKIVSEGTSGGGLPLEDLGAQLNGDGITKINFGYNLMIGNGIASTPTNDFNESKSMCLNLHAEPIENLKFYISGYADNIPKGTTTIQGVKTTQNINLQILNASIAYRDGKLPIELIGEFYNLRTMEPDSNNSASSNGYFLYFSYKIRKINLIPYVYYDRLLLDTNDPLFFKNNIASIAFGLRYVIHPLSAIKLEYKYSETGLIKYQNRIELQFAIGF